LELVVNLASTLHDTRYGVSVRNSDEHEKRDSAHDAPGVDRALGKLPFRYRYAAFAPSVIAIAACLVVWPFSGWGWEWIAVIALASLAGFVGMMVGFVQLRHAGVEVEF
jgi:hypothetical protein